MEKKIEIWVEKLARTVGARQGSELRNWVQYEIENSSEDEDELDELIDAVCARLAAMPRRQPPQPQGGRRRDDGRPGGGRSGGGPERSRSPVPDSDRTAPYRFVHIEDAVTLAPAPVREPQNHIPLPGGFTGSLQIEWAFETPMLIGDNTQERDVSVPTKIDSKYMIPGGTLRGLVRAAMERVTRARLTQVNAHHRYGVRDFDHTLFADEDLRRSRGVPKAGWLRKATSDELRQMGADDSPYVIEECDLKLIKIRDLPQRLNSGGSVATGDWHLSWLRRSLADKYAAAGMRKEGHFDFGTTFPFLRDEEMDVLADKKERTTSPRGVLVFSNNLPMARPPRGMTQQQHDAGIIADLDAQDSNSDAGHYKKRECVFFDRLGSTPTPLTAAAFQRFELLNTKPSKNKPKADGSYGELKPTLDKGLRIPVFFFGSLQDQDGLQLPENRLEIGLTRLFKLGHTYSVADKLRKLKTHAVDLSRPDMVEALFGHVYEDQDFASDDERRKAARKGRIAFGFAYLVPQTNVRTTERIETVSMAPRASYAPFYTRGRVKDWSHADSKLAGRKQYFPRFTSQGRASAAASITTTLESQLSNDNRDSRSRMRLLAPTQSGAELVFKGTVRLHNVLAEEVGAVLWALTHGGDPAKPYRHMIGRAKWAGAGQARVKSIALKLNGHDETADAMLSPPEEWELPSAKCEGWTIGKQGLTSFLKAFDSYMKREADKSWPQTQDLREHLGIASVEHGAAIVAASRARHPEFPSGFRRIRTEVKDAPRAFPPAAESEDRLLPAPAVDRVETPYCGPGR